nr:cation transporter [Marinicella sp. W31]MDC2878829.1 cation transporter [Marinicella sp. W31]
MQRKVTNALGRIDGVSDIDVSLDAAAASFALAAPATREHAVEAIEDAGYDVVA